MNSSNSPVERGAEGTPARDVDRALLSALARDGRASYTDLAERVGLSVSAVHEAREAAENDTADYLGVGAMYSTDTKSDAEYGGPELLRSVRNAVELPLVAIGGITLDRAGEVWSAGADLLAVVSAVFGAPDSGAAARALLQSRQ